MCKYPKRYANTYANKYANKSAQVSKQICKQKYANNETIKIASSSGIFKTIYNNSSYLLLFGERN